jgi:ribonuclease HI
VLIQEEGGSFEREVWEYIGDATNNVAEYRALLLALREAASLKPASVRIRSDSQLLVRQLAGDYRVKHPHLIDLHARARELIKAFPVVQVEHVRRDANARADRLANRAIDEALAAKRAGEEHSSGEAGDRGADA